MKYQKQIDALHLIRLKLSDDLKEEMEDILYDLTWHIENEDFLNDIDKSNAIDTAETVSEYLPSNYSIIVADSLNAEYDLQNFIEQHIFLREIR